MYGNLINFISPEPSEIPFKCSDYKRVYKFTQEDYPFFFGNKKNKGDDSGMD